MKKKKPTKVPAVVEQGKELNLDAIIGLLDEAAGNILAVSCAIRMHRDHRNGVAKHEGPHIWRVPSPKDRLPKAA